MPDYDPTSVVDAYYAKLISKSEAREVLGFPDSSLEDEVAALKRKLDEAADFARREYLRGYDHGKKDREWQEKHPVTAFRYAPRVG